MVASPVLATFRTSFLTVVWLNQLRKPCETPRCPARRFRETTGCRWGRAALLAEVSVGQRGQGGDALFLFSVTVPAGEIPVRPPFPPACVFAPTTQQCLRQTL